MSYFYSANRIGSGTKTDPYLPDIPAGISFVGYEKGGNYLILTNELLADNKKTGLTNITDKVNNFLADKGLTVDDIAKWFVGDR